MDKKNRNESLSMPLCRSANTLRQKKEVFKKMLDAYNQAEMQRALAFRANNTSNNVSGAEPAMHSALLADAHAHTDMLSWSYWSPSHSNSTLHLTCRMNLRLAWISLIKPSYMIQLCILYACA